MMTDEKTQKLCLQLDESMDLLKKALSHLNYSYEKCKNIDFNLEIDEEMYESLEAATSRFARTADIFTQKTVRTIFEILREKPDFFIDGANLLEKWGIVDNAAEIVAIRDLRNVISHEYKEREMKKIYRDTLNYVPVLINAIQNLEKFISEKL